MYNQNYLSHYGKIGMRWGHRNPGEVKKSFQTRTYERLADSGEKHRKIQEEYYKRDGDSYSKSSAERWAKESKENREAAKKSYEMDKYKATDRKGYKQLVKGQKEYDQNVKNNWWKAYIVAADHANQVMIPALNKKYKDSDWSSLKFENGKAVSGDPKLIKVYNKYNDEYNSQFQDILNASYKDMFGDRPEIPKK